jgi:hypothetical protein
MLGRAVKIVKNDNQSKIILNPENCSTVFIHFRLQSVVEKKEIKTCAKSYFGIKPASKFCFSDVWGIKIYFTK